MKRVSVGGWAVLLCVVWPVLDLGAIDIESGEHPISIHGFASQGFLKSDRNNFLADTEKGTFEFHEYGLNAVGRVSERIHAGAQVFGRDLGRLGNDEIELDWAHVDFRWRDWLGLRAGRVKLAHGLYNETRDLDLLRTSVFLPQSVYNESWRDSTTSGDGGTLYGSIPVRRAGSVSYCFQYCAKDIDRDGGLAKYIEGESGVDLRDIDVSSVIAGSLQWHTPVEGLRVGWSLLDTEFDCDSTLSDRPEWGARGAVPGLPVTLAIGVNGNTYSVEYTRSRWVLAAEYMRYGVDLSMNLPDGGSLYGESSPIEGYYASAAYRFSRWAELGAAYSVYYPDGDDRDGRELAMQTGRPQHDAWLKDWSATLRFDLREDLALKIEGHAMDGAAVALVDDNPEGTREHWFLFASKVTYSF